MKSVLLIDDNKTVLSTLEVRLPEAESGSDRLMRNYPDVR